MKIDLLPYMKGTGRVYSVRPSWTTYQAMQVQEDGNYWYQVKWSEWEELFNDDQFIYRAMDTSMGNGRVYDLRDNVNKIGSAWVKRHMELGEVFERNPIVTVYNKFNGNIASRNTVRSWIKLAQYIPMWRSPVNSTITINNVVVLEWYLDEGLTQLAEQYFYGKGYGLVGFKTSGLSAFIESVFEAGRAPHLVRETVHWYKPPANPLPAVSTPDEPTTILVVRDDAIYGVNVRQGPTTRTPRVKTIQPGTLVHVLGVVDGQDNDGFKWYVTESGFIREDLLEDPNATPSDSIPLFSSPLQAAYVIRQNHGENGHKGVDLAVPQNSLVVPGTVGQVAFLYECTKCSANAPNFISNGLAMHDPAGLNDPAWGFGYGNGVVLRHHYKDLPSIAQARMASMGLRNGYAYIIYAHLMRIYIEQGDCVSPSMGIGLTGNTGNSSGPHLHLEIRGSARRNENSIYGRPLLDPRWFFNL